MKRQRAPEDREDRVREELRLLSPLMDMYTKWTKEDVQDLDGESKLTIHSSMWAMLDALSARFEYAQAALRERHDAEDAEVIAHLGFDPFD